MPHLSAATRRVAIVALREAADFLILANATAFDKSRYDDSADAEIIAACELLGLTCKRAETDPGVCHEDTILEGHKWDKPSERDVLQGARASATDAQFCEVA